MKGNPMNALTRSLGLATLALLLLGFPAAAQTGEAAGTVETPDTAVETPETPVEETAPVETQPEPQPAAPPEEPKVEPAPETPPAPKLTEADKSVLGKLEKFTKTEKFTLEGKAFVRYWYDINDSTVEEPGEKEAHNNSFELWRMYFGFRSQLAKWLTIRFTADAGPEKKGVKTSEVEDHTHTVDGDQAYGLFVKFAWFDFEPLKDLHLRAGVIENPYHEGIDSFWGYRYVSKNVGEEEKYYNSADLGAYLKYLLPKETGSVLVGFANGAGYKSALDMDRNKELWVHVALNPLATVHELAKPFAIGGFVQYPMITDGDLDRELFVGAFIGWSHPWVAFGYQPLVQITEDAETDDSTVGVGHGVYFRFDTPIKLGLLARFGAIDEDIDSDDPRMRYSFLAGLSYTPAKFFAIAASTLVGWSSDDDDPLTVEPEKDIRLILSTQFEY